MKLLKTHKTYDFGHDLYVQLINTGRHYPKFLKNKSLIQFTFSWGDYPSWPYLQVTVGSGRLFGIIFWLYKFGFDLDIFSNTWNWDYLIEDETEDQTKDEL